jgi:hypothetical protein
MKPLFLTAAVALIMGSSAGIADVMGPLGVHASLPTFDVMSADDEIERRGRGRGRGGRGGETVDTGGGSGGHGGRPRIPGGSGCDDPEDLIEHPECRVGLN